MNGKSKSTDGKEILDSFNPSREWFSTNKERKWEKISDISVGLSGPIPAEEYDIEELTPTDSPLDIENLSTEADYCRVNIEPYKAPEVCRVKKIRIKSDLNPRNLFVPSPSLTNLIKNSLDQPDEDELFNIKRLLKFHRKPHENIPDLSELSQLISMEVEGYLSNLARREISINNEIFISRGKRFATFFYNELSERLQLDSYNSRPVMDKLYHELFQFVSEVPHERNWGSIVIENSNIKLEVSEKALMYPDFGSPKRQKGFAM